MSPHRSQLETIVGHDLLKDLVRKMVERESIPHALLFHGPDGIGKKDMAYAVGKFINCRGEPGSTACRCSTCTKVSRDTHLDFTVLKPKGGRVISIDEIRAVQDRAWVTPVEARKRVILIFDAERMSRSAANGLLKILEEPPSHLVIIMTTDNPNNLLPTIRSRCMSFRFHPVPVDEIKSWLIRERGVTEPEAEVAALLSEGRPGPALEIIEGGFLDRRNEMIREIDLLSEKGYPAIFRIAQKLCPRGVKLENALDDMLVWYRDLLVSRLAPGKKDILVNRDQSEELQSRSSRFTETGLFEAFRRVLESQDYGRRFVNPYLVLFVLLTKVGSSLKNM